MHGELFLPVEVRHETARFRVLFRNCDVRRRAKPLAPVAEIIVALILALDLGRLIPAGWPKAA